MKEGKPRELDDAAQQVERRKRRLGIKPSNDAISVRLVPSGELSDGVVVELRCFKCEKWSDARAVRWRIKQCPRCGRNVPINLQMQMQIDSLTEVLVPVFDRIRNLEKQIAELTPDGTVNLSCELCGWAKEVPADGTEPKYCPQCSAELART